MSTFNASGSKIAAIPQPNSASGPLVVALLYNTNGMATWCWEAAHALRELGRDVILIAAPDTPLPGAPEFEVIRIDIGASPASPRRKIGSPISASLRYLRAEPDGLLKRIHAHLAARGVRPAAYILNQSTLVDRSVDCPQLMAAWSYPVDLFSYLRKIPLVVQGRDLKAFVRALLSSAGWWRNDWRAYRTADRVLPVTQALLKSLLGRSVRSNLAYPGTCVSPVPDRAGNEIRLLMAAVKLGESRKRILWMLEAMTEMRPPAGTVLQLAGEPDESVLRAAAKMSFPVECLGHLKRQELQEVMQKAHVFCFGSLLDDWGYVLVEAMANGLVPVAPATSPFDEILAGVGSCYIQNNQQDFVRALTSSISGDLQSQGRKAWDRALTLFSRQAFGRSILASLETLSRPK